jgi:6-phosphofructo-2-kinase / fructose-2,6-biphosphatase 4
MDLAGAFGNIVFSEFYPRPELGDYLAMPDVLDRTPETAANSPHYRRSSSTFIDGVHDLIVGEQHMAPAQLYSTLSGRLFHSGRIAIVLVGLPARGKTYVNYCSPLLIIRG